MHSASMYTAFQARAQEAPSTRCIEDRRGQVTRAELGFAVDELAGRLRRLGAGGRLAGVFVDRDRDSPTCLLAVQAAFAAYLPLDPRHPDERIRAVLADAEPACVITTSALRHRLPADIPALIVDDPTLDPAAIRDVATNPDLAYVIFTSGSTGRPKGVAISDESVRSFLSALDEVVGGTPEQVWQWLASIAFDSTIPEMVWPLTRGHYVCLWANDPLSVLESPLVKGTVDGRSVTTVLCTPSLARVLISDPDGLAALRSLDLILFGGEPFPLDVVDHLRSAGGTGPRVMNAYGPTEATVAVAFCIVDERTPRPISIGEPIRTAGFHILHEDLTPTREGEAGVLFISGECLAKGYFRRPDLTAERFASLSKPNGQITIYNTGDVAVRYPHGVVITGRADDQVKVRGNRVELGEIEHVLQSHPQIEDAACFVDARNGFATELIAALVSTLDESVIREWLSVRLPAYMIPSRLYFEDALPLNASGKVDRQAVRNLTGR